MTAFDQVIGYEAIKKDLLQICDMIQNPEIYQRLGAQLPSGILLYGEPGLGKTLLANCFIQDCGLPDFTIRRTGNDDSFLEYIQEIFESALQAAPSIILLDDLDKFSNSDSRHRDTKEFVAVQSGIDRVNRHGVIVIATANNESKLPDSLIRAGRFDKTIEVKLPTNGDAEKIIGHFLKGKPLSDDVELSNLVRMLSCRSCAEMESILNAAAIRAAFSRKGSISMDDLVKTILEMEYQIKDFAITAPEDEKWRCAIHEAGHLVASEILYPGSVGFATICQSENGCVQGLCHSYNELRSRNEYIIVCLAGKAASELYFADSVDYGASRDLRDAIRNLRHRAESVGTYDVGVISLGDDDDRSEIYRERLDIAVREELNRYILKVKEILLKNKDFLEKTAAALVEQETILYSDICRIRSAVEISQADT